MYSLAVALLRAILSGDDNNNDNNAHNINNGNDNNSYYYHYYYDNDNDNTNVKNNDDPNTTTNEFTNNNARACIDWRPWSRAYEPLWPSVERENASYGFMDVKLNDDRDVKFKLFSNI